MVAESHHLASNGETQPAGTQVCLTFSFLLQVPKWVPVPPPGRAAWASLPSRALGLPLPGPAPDPEQWRHARGRTGSQHHEPGCTERTLGRPFLGALFQVLPFHLQNEELIVKVISDLVVARSLWFSG